MEQSLEHTVALLANFPAALDGLLRGLPDAWTREGEGEKTWSPFDVVVHLLQTEHTNWMARVRHILEDGETKPFAPLDRWANLKESQAKPLSDLLEEFARQRKANLEELGRLQLGAGDLAKRGVHPRFGIVTLSQLLATWAVHDMTHLHQISRTIAYQYRDAVGPWTEFLGVLRCNGHSETA